MSDAQVSEQCFYVLLWRSQPEAARNDALRMVAETRPSTAGMRRARKASYDEAMELDSTERTRYWSILLKLCDIAFVGDLATERAFREQYYGSLR